MLLTLMLTTNDCVIFKFIVMIFNNCSCVCMFKVVSVADFVLLCWIDKSVPFVSRVSANI
ncbi:hypothetical protein HanRHA438_Chr11g0531561 [Helianthus annuus]|nr:hypothetical protein HanIR_Chr11g0560001 [Helianthus annuus]KAJ0873141.1 hypothetical protein HanRHA438_Chr11g0531561 [Helianthus annuus]